MRPSSNPQFSICLNNDVVGMPEDFVSWLFPSSLPELTSLVEVWIRDSKPSFHRNDFSS